MIDNERLLRRIDYHRMAAKTRGADDLAEMLAQALRALRAPEESLPDDIEAHLLERLPVYVKRHPNLLVRQLAGLAHQSVSACEIFTDRVVDQLAQVRELPRYDADFTGEMEQAPKGRWVDYSSVMALLNFPVSVPKTDPPEETGGHHFRWNPYVWGTVSTESTTILISSVALNLINRK